MKPFPGMSAVKAMWLAYSSRNGDRGAR